MKDGHSCTVSLYIILNHMESQPAHLRVREANVAMVAIRKTFSLDISENSIFLLSHLFGSLFGFCNLCFNTVRGVQMGTCIFLGKKKNIVK